MHPAGGSQSLGSTTPVACCARSSYARRAVLSKLRKTVSLPIFLLSQRRPRSDNSCDTIAIVSQLLSDRGRRWLNKKMGNDTVFLNFDSTARRAYEDRAQHATGVVE